MDKIQELEYELKETQEVVLLLCEKIEELEESANKAWALFDKVKNNPIVKKVLK
jgi:hypothetical protein